MPTMSIDWFLLPIILTLIVCITWYNVTRLKCDIYYEPDEDESE